MSGIAVGAAASGLRPVVMLANTAFSLLAFDQIVNQAARMRYMFGAQRSLPIVFRAGYHNGTNMAAQHSMTGYAFYAHAAGLKVVVPSDPEEAAALLRTAVRDDNPVFMFEAGRVQSMQAEAIRDDPIPFGEGKVRRQGMDVTVVGIGYMLNVALAAADRVAQEGISAEVIDPRTLVPFDADTVKSSVLRTGRLVVVDESFPTCSFASEIVARVLCDADVFRRLSAPPQSVCTLAVPTPFSPPLERAVLPDEADVCSAIRTVVGQE
jgi:pyruvate dehydrogenase E1 component beta subunit